jgi:glycosyltransferase involved in cell wall biosynthesis
LLELNSQNAVNVVILLDTHAWMLTPFLKVCKKCGIIVIHERTEYPLVTIKRKVFGILHFWLYKRLIINKLDGIFVINSALRNYFTNLTKRRIPVEVINMIVDPTRFDKPEKSNNYPYRYIAYCGSMGAEKDGTDILIKAFCKAVEGLREYEDLKLILVGEIPDKSTGELLARAISETGCQGKVIFTGFIKRQSIPEILNNAMALALARPSGIQAEGGFPTKLGEYLATGKPVIVTNTGEIGIYLKDGYNAFVAEPGSVESFSDKIKEVLRNYVKATEIGHNGKKLVYNDFNYLSQANRLIDFIHSIENA